MAEISELHSRRYRVALSRESRGARRRMRSLSVGGAVLLLLLTGCAAVGAGAAPRRAELARGKPNVVMIMTDDQWLESMRVMPRTQRIFGEQGVRFEQYHPSMPLCCPSRSTFLSGQFAHNNGVRHNAAPGGGYDKLDDRNTLPVWMRRAGYHTSHIGKYPNGYGVDNEREVPPGWDEWRGSVDPTTYQMWGYRLNENGRLKTYGKAHQEDPRLYQTDVYRDKAADFIRRKAGKQQPFFLSVAFLAPHGENVHKTRKHEADPNEPRVGPAPRPAPRHKGRFAHEPLPPMPSYNEADMSDKPTFLRDYPPLPPSTTDKIAQSYRGRLESLLAVDEAVGGLVRTLKESGQLDNTYLVFASDNGFFFGQHRVPTGKFLPHSASGHVPMMIRGPGIPGGRGSRELVSNPDLTATIANIGGAEPTLKLDGRSLLPFARDPRRHTGRPVLHEAASGALRSPVGAPQSPESAESAEDERVGRQAAQGDLDQDGTASPKPAKKREGGPGQVLSASYESIRTERYLYIRYTKGGRELYDLHTDPHEMNSRHQDPRYAKVREFLDRNLDQLQGCQGQACQRELPPAPPPEGS